MKTFNMTSLMIPMLAALAIYFPLSSALLPSEQRSSAASPSNQLVQMVSPPTPTPTPTPSPNQVQGEAAKLLCDFFGFKPVSGDAQKSSEAENLKGDYCRIKLNRQKYYPYYEIEYLIATIPDPKDSRLDHLFDRDLDAIQRAIEAAGYVFDRHSLLWDKSRTAMPAASSTVQPSPRYTREPGVILFRKIENTAKPRLLLLFLVGETPTSGIHRLAFQNTLWQIEHLAGWAETKTQPPSPEDLNKSPLRIVGPTFSGSAVSLAMGLNSWLCEYTASPPPEVKVVSGSATAIKKQDFLKMVGQPGVSFHSTVVTDEEARKAFIKYLSGADSKITPPDDEDEWARTHIALLTEANTIYGQTAVSEIMEQNQLEIQRHLETKAIRETKQKTQSAAQSTQPAGIGAPEVQPPPAGEHSPLILSLTFPLHISQLRIEAAKTKPSRNGATDTLTAKDSNLALPMGEGGDPKSKDVIPLFSPLETVTTELVLSEILSAINRERIRYVGLSSTDVQDRMFLAREIRKHCPNAVIFSLSSDLLYLHSEVNLDLQGTLVISPYPLFGLNQLWTYPFAGDQTRLQFTTQSAQGCYNATLALLGREDLMLEYGAPFETYRSGKMRHPALWLSIVGRNGIWPVKTFEVKTQSGEEPYTLPVRSEERSANAIAAGSNKREPRLGLSGNYLSPMGVGLLLLVGFVCLIPPLVLLAQLILFRIERARDKIKLEKKKRKPSKFGYAIRTMMLKLESEAEEERGFALIRWTKRGWLGQVFGDEEFYRYRLDRRIYLMACCVSLLTVSLFISGVAVLPGWMKTDGLAVETEWELHWLICIAAYAVLALTLIAILWLAWSIIEWMIRGARHFRGHFWAALVLAFGTVMITLVGWGLIELLFRASLTEQVFFFLRATELTSGVSLLLPALLIGLAAFLSFFAAVRRLNLAERMPCLREPQQKISDVPQFLRFDHERARSFEGLKALENRVKEMIVCRSSGVPGAVPAAILILIVYTRLFLWHFIPSVDGRWFDLFFKMAFYLAPLLLVWAFLRFFWLWMALRKLLRRLAWHPLFSQYAVMHSEEKQFAMLPQIDLMTPTPTYTSLSLSVRQARQFQCALNPVPGQAGTGQRIEQLVDEAENRLRLALNYESKGFWQEAIQNRRQSQAALAELTEPVTELLEESWQAPSSLEGGNEAWQNEGKFFLLTHVVAFLQHIFAHLQNLVALVTIGFLLMLLAANSYPFQPREPLLLFSWVTILTAVALTLFIFVQMSRDKVLSLLAGTTPGKLNVTRDFVLRVLVHGVVPIIALLGAQFPAALRQIFSWLSILEGKGN
jgi:hypothetical protein